MKSTKFGLLGLYSEPSIHVLETALPCLGAEANTLSKHMWIKEGVSSGTVLCNEGAASLDWLKDRNFPLGISHKAVFEYGESSFRINHTITFFLYWKVPY